MDCVGDTEAERECADPVQTFKPAKILSRPDYAKPANYKNDLTLIELDGSATITGLYS